MKAISIIALMFISLIAFSQTEINERGAINKKHIDFSTQIVCFDLTGLIQLNGVIFNNDTCSCQIAWKGSIDNVKLYNKCTNQEYEFIEFISFGKLNIISIVVKNDNAIIGYPNFQYFNDDGKIYLH